ncbi:hypothetical protein FJZ20_00085 [Candidatus Pacearchaeota archaeon]|nr:hypothetical protein [Candidatus Pacearchaeota archaeon]
MTPNLEEGEIVLCTVDRIIGTNVFVKIPLQNKEMEGCIVTSEIAPGRIRNIRDYVVPKKKIVCKILRISGDRIELSLRRVTKQEQKEIKEKSKQEKSYESILRSVLNEGANSVIKEITSKSDLYNFFKEAKENKKELEKLVGKKDAEKILEILNSQKPKSVILKKEIFLVTAESEGINLIKEFLEKIKDVEIRYIAAGRYSLKKESTDVKKDDQELKNLLVQLEKEAKNRKIEFSILKK